MDFGDREGVGEEAWGDEDGEREGRGIGMDRE